MQCRRAVEHQGNSDLPQWVVMRHVEGEICHSIATSNDLPNPRVMEFSRDCHSTQSLVTIRILGETCPEVHRRTSIDYGLDNRCPIHEARHTAHENRGITGARQVKRSSAVNHADNHCLSAAGNSIATWVSWYGDGE